MHPIGNISSRDADSSKEAELLQLHFQSMLVQWGSNQPPRGGLHASSLLVEDKEWCTRRYVLSELFPDAAEAPALNSWDWKRTAIFENGWSLHVRWQQLFRQFARVAYGNTNNVKGDTVTVSPELDLTHYDAERDLYFSPDAIIDFGAERYVVEIKGIKQEAYLELTDDLQVAMDSCETVHKAYYQCQLYMHLLELKKGIILVENKNNQEFKLWVIEYNKDAVMPNILRAYEVKGALVGYKKKVQKLPARICQSKSDPLARQCPMVAKCFSEGMEK